jgi:Zn-dependent peptidase ImmA (M78 family)
MAPRFSLARRKAAELLRAGQVTRPPVPVEMLATLVGAVICYEPFAGQLSGMVHRQPNGSAVIGVNSLHAETRRRFTIAHELGHLLLHTDEDFHIDETFPVKLRDEVSSMAIDEHEIEANQFAAEILMPLTLLAHDRSELPVDLESDEAITRLAQRYGVSVQAMTIRLSGALR